MDSGSFVWRCPSCDKPYRIKAGRKPPAQCPRCESCDEDRLYREFQAAVADPVEPEVPKTYDVLNPEPEVAEPFVVPPPLFVPPSTKQQFRDFVKSLRYDARWAWKYMTPWLCMACALWLWTTPPGFQFLGLISCPLVFALWVVKRKSLRRLPSWASVITWLVLVWAGEYLIYRYSYFVERFGDEDFDITSHKGRDFRTFRQSLHSKKGEPFLSAHGNISDSGKRHGEWHFGAASKGFWSQWYWYGEDVTEGEWHLRNK